MLIRLSETDVSLINYDNDINDYGFWIKMNLEGLVAVIESFINEEKITSIDSVMSKCFETMTIGKKRRSDDLDNDLTVSMQSMNLTKRNKIIEDPYMADTEN